MIYLQLQEENAKESIAPTQFVEKAVTERLKMMIPYKSRWPQAIAIMSLPPNVTSALATLLTLADDICYYAGDRSVDVSLITRFCVSGSNLLCLDKLVCEKDSVVRSV